MDNPNPTFEHSMRDTLLKRVENDFAFHPADSTTGAIHQMVRDECLKLVRGLVQLCPPSRELSLSLSSLQETMMWANAAIACNQKPDGKEAAF